ncbi:MAG: hypothetical protein MUW56_22430 [Chryseobacterium sp.]|uniref:hypothetical protein n=1 Tax=Chryseobacterium sp. TaxID=1871047 RepID=UPI0025BF7C8B|nr:hypothetical protein [Chryseobacterium sp.]MCJ7936312.1 hypothetical protein [Chryseobacterium sp.]
MNKTLKKLYKAQKSSLSVCFIFMNILFFDEVENKGSLEDVPDRVMTREKFLETVKEYLFGKWGE